MKPVPKSMFTVVRVGLIAVVLTACGLSTHYPIPSGPMTTLIPGWERHFMLEWTVEPEHGGSRRLDGYIFNRYGERSEERRVGKKCRSRWVADQLKKKKKDNNKYVENGIKTVDDTACTKKKKAQYIHATE